MIANLVCRTPNRQVSFPARTATDDQRDRCDDGREARHSEEAPRKHHFVAINGTCRGTQRREPRRGTRRGKRGGNRMLHCCLGDTRKTKLEPRNENRETRTEKRIHHGKVRCGGVGPSRDARRKRGGSSRSARRGHRPRDLTREASRTTLSLSSWKTWGSPQGHAPTHRLRRTSEHTSMQPSGHTARHTRHLSKEASGDTSQHLSRKTWGHPHGHRPMQSARRTSRHASMRPSGSHVAAPVEESVVAPAGTLAEAQVEAPVGAHSDATVGSHSEAYEAPVEGSVG